MSPAAGANEPTRELSHAFEIAARVRNLPAHLREMAVISACGGDTALSNTVLDLLQSGEPVPEADGVDPTGATRCATVFGRYVLQDRLGSGGMGVVYRALHIDTGRTVALKLLRPGSISEAVLRRFQSEIVLLARLRHPSIVQILDAGHVEFGDRREPYLAMELVEGLPLLTGVRQLGLDRRAIVTLLIELCEATAHAHRRGVIHRDLKPENIRLDTEATPVRPRILDFGVATPVQSVHDTAATVVGTLGYMAPEQLEGDVDLRGDIYSLGAIAFELLTGERAVPVRGMPIATALRVMRNQDPPQARLLDRTIDADLSAILAKALARDPDRRYASADLFARDLARWRDGLTVEAQPRTPLYVLRTFVRRRRLLTAAVAVVGIGLATSATITIRSYAEARAANSDMHAMLGGTLVELRRMVDHGDRPTTLPADLGAALSRLVQRAPNDPVVRRMEAEFVHLESDLARQHGRLDVADRLRRRLVDVRTMLAEQDPGPANRRELAVALVLVGDVVKEMAPAGETPAETRTRYEEAHRLFERLVAEQPHDRRARDDYGHSCLRLSWLACGTRDLAGSEQWLRVAAPVVEALASDHPEHPYTHDLHRQFLAQTAHVAELAGRSSDALALNERMVEHMRQARRMQPDRIHTAMLHLASARSLGGVSRRLGRPDLAQRAYEEADGVASFLLDKAPDNTSAIDAIFLLRTDEARLELDQGSVVQAFRTMFRATQEVLRLRNLRGLPQLPDRLGRLAEVTNAALAAVEHLTDEERDTALMSARPLLAGFGLLVAEAPFHRGLTTAFAWLQVLVGDEADVAEARATLAEARRDGWFDTRLWLIDVLRLEREGDIGAARASLADLADEQDEDLDPPIERVRTRLRRQ